MPATVAPRHFETLPEAAARLRCHPRTLRRRIAAGDLSGYRLGGSPLVRVDSADVDALLRPIPAVCPVA